MVVGLYIVVVGPMVDLPIGLIANLPNWHHRKAQGDTSQGPSHYAKLLPIKGGMMLWS